MTTTETETTMTTTAPIASALTTAGLTVLKAVPPAPPITPGWRTSEFWLKLIAYLLTCLFASGVITDDRQLATMGIGASILGAMGYSVSRSYVKATAIKNGVGSN